MKSLLARIRRYLPDAVKVDGRERARSVLGAMLGIFITGLAGQLMIGSETIQPWLVASMGASAVLLFTTPASPLAQPWPVVGGNLLSALIGVTCAKFIGNPLAADAVPTERLGVTPADLDAVLKQYNQVLDVSRTELEEILLRAEARAYQRRFGHVTCSDIMSRDVVKVEFGTGLQDAWHLLREHEIKALPVVNRFNRVIGIVTQHDFIKQLDLDVIDGFSDKLRRMLKPTRHMHSEKSEVVGQIMTKAVQTASLDQSILGPVPLFSDSGLRHLPIVDRNQRLVGILTQSDVVAALYRSQLKHAVYVSKEESNDLQNVA